MTNMRGPATVIEVKKPTYKEGSYHWPTQSPKDRLAKTTWHLRRKHE
jgi:hypothetical protein